MQVQFQTAPAEDTRQPDRAFDAITRLVEQLDGGVQPLGLLLEALARRAPHAGPQRLDLG